MTKKKTKAELAAEAVVKKASADLQAKGSALFLEYYYDGLYAHAKLAAGMTFTPESVEYMERAVKNRRVAEEIRKENTADIKEESDNEHAETDFDSGNVAAGPSGIAGAADGGGAADDAGAGGSTKHPAAGSPRGGAA